MPVLLKGDCLEVMKGLPDGSVDCFVCDLPYGCLAAGYARPGHNEEVARKVAKLTNAHTAWDIKIDLVAFWEQVKRLARDDHVPVLMFCNTRFGIDLITSNPSWFRYDLVWDKGVGVSFLLANKQPMKSHEMVYVFSKKGTYYKRIDEDSDKPGYSYTPRPGAGRVYSITDNGKPREMVDGKRCSLSVVRAGKKAFHKGTHPTEKPMELYRWLLARYCPEGGTVLDPTAGSFNSVAAAEELGLKGIGIEKDESFFAKALARWPVDVSGGGDVITHA